MERCRLALFDGEVEGWLFGVEDAAAERVGGEEAVSAGVPVGGVAGVAGVVDDGDGGSVGAGVAGERTPAAAGGPDGSALDAFAGEVDAGCGFGVGRGDLGGVAVGVHENTALFVGRFEPVGDTHSEKALFVVVEDGLVERGEGDGLVDGALAVALAEDVLRGLLQDVPVSYTHLRAHETGRNLVCRLLL